MQKITKYISNNVLVEDRAMAKRICDRCGYAYEAKCNVPNIIYLCPKCFNYVGCECEYGVGPIVPCSILLTDMRELILMNAEQTMYMNVI